MLKFIIFFLAKIPFKINRFIGLLFGLIFILGGKNKKIVTQNIQLCFPLLNKQQQQKLINNSLIELAYFMIETPYIWNHKITQNSKIITSIKGLELINNKKKIILLAPHFGSFEVLGKVIANVRAVTLLYKKSKKKYINDIIVKNRELKNLKLVATDIRGIASLNKLIKNNQLVGILPDQYPKEGAGIFVDFFGIPAKTTTLLVKLAAKHNATVVLAYAKRNKKGFDIVLEEVNLKAQSSTESVVIMNKIIEDLVKKFPNQYLWNYKRFRGSHNYR